MSATVPRAQLDPITFQVLQSRLSGIVKEMQDGIFRTGYSTIIRESQDASCVLLDVDGNVVGEHVILPLHLSCLPSIVHAIREVFGDDIRAGDAYITNHPYLAGTPHSMDMAVVTPAFSDGRLLGFCASIAHKSDLGGVVAGTANGSAREIFQEGIQYPPTRIERDGVMLRDIEAIIRANSRTPDVVMGDIRGQIGVARLGETRLAETIARYGLDTVIGAFAMMQDVAEKRIRTLLSAWPDGEAEAERFLDGQTPETPVRFHVKVSKKGDRIHFDFSGCDDQSLGPINIRPPLAFGSAYFALIAMLDPELPNNGGVARVCETTFRRGSILDPIFPAPTNTYMPSATALTEVCIRALGYLCPERLVGGTGGGGGTSIGGRRADGSSFLQYELSGSSFGATPINDGPSGIAVLLNNARCASIEILESEFPSQVVRWELVTDSGGTGTYRGGLGSRRVTKTLAPSAQLTLRAAGHWVAGFGVEGGGDGAFAKAVLNPGTPNEQVLPGRFSGHALQPGDVLLDERGGGGGYGDPRKRTFEAIVADVLDGYVSRAAAIADYGADAAALDAALAEYA